MKAKTFIPELLNKQVTSSPRIKWVLKSIEGVKGGGRLLNVGCSQGIFHDEIKKANPDIEVIGIDVLNSGNGVVGDAGCLPFKDKSFDVVFCGEVVEHTYGVIGILSECARVLKDNGCFILTTPNPFSWWPFLKCWILTVNVLDFLGDYNHKWLLDPLSLTCMLWSAGFYKVRVTTRGHCVPFLNRFYPALLRLDIRAWPFTRLGGYTCIVCRKK